MLLAGAPFAAAQTHVKTLDCERRDSQQDASNALGWVASEERVATSVRRVGGEATLRALASTEVVDMRRIECPTCRLAVARFAGRGPFLALRRREGEREVCDNRVMTLVALV